MPIAQLTDVALAYEQFPATSEAREVGRATIVLIRGLGTQLIEWPASFVDGLAAAGFDVVVFDNRDCGLSTKFDSAVDNPPYQLADMADDVVGLLDHLEVDRAHIFGISLGGMVAQHVAFSHADLVTSLISVMSTSGNPELPPMDPDQRELLSRVAADVEQAVVFDTESRLIWGSPGYPISEGDRAAAATRAVERCYCPAGSARQAQAAVADGSRVERLAKVKVPTLVIHGADDTLISAEAGIDTARCIPGAELEVVAGMGHNIPPSLGGWLADRVVRFVA